MDKKICLKIFRIVLLEIIFCLALYSYPNLIIFKDYKNISITSLKDKNELSQGTEVWITSVIVDNNNIDLENIKHDDNWIYTSNCLVFVGNEASEVNLKVPLYSEVKISFMKHPYSGKVLVKNSDVEKEYDLYSENSNNIMYNSVNKNIPLFSILLNSIIYLVITLIILFIVNKFVILKPLLILCLYLFLCFMFKITDLKLIISCFCFYISVFLIYKNYRNNILFILIPLLIYFLLNILVIPLNFAMTVNSTNSIYFVVHLSFIVVLFYLFNFIINFIIKIKEGNKEYNLWLKYSLIFLAICFIYLLLIWPGNWVWDEKGVLMVAQGYLFNSWQSYLTVLFYSWSLMIFPFIVGIPIFQALIFSLIIGHILSKIYLFNNSKLEIIILFILLALPPVILNILYPLRTILYVGIELLLLFNIYYWWRIDKKLDIYNILFFGGSIIILAFWRTEGIYYLILAPLLIWFIYRKQFDFQKIICLILALLLFIGIYSPIKILEKDNPNNYFLTIFPNALSLMLQNENLRISLSEYASLNKVLNLEVVRQYPAYNEIPSFHVGGVQNDYQEHMKEFLFTYAKIIIKNPVDYLLARSKTFLATTGMDKMYPNNSPWGFYDTIYEGNDEEIINMINNDALSKSLSYPIRSKAIAILKGVNLKEPTQMAWYGQIIWNFLPMLLTLVISLIYCFLKKNYGVAGLTLLCLIKAPLVFVTAPANYFFYYLSIYIIGLFPIGLLIYKLIERRIKIG